MSLLKRPIELELKNIESLDIKNEGIQNDEPSWDNFEVLEILGEGSYGKIFKVREKHGEKRVLAIKEIDQAELRNDYEALAEINVMARMDSPYIVKYYDSFV